MGPDANVRPKNSVFNSALVISARVLLLLRDVAPLLPEIIGSSLLDIEKAESIIEKLTTNGKTARSCLSFLHRLRTALTQLGIALPPIAVILLRVYVWLTVSKHILYYQQTATPCRSCPYKTTQSTESRSVSPVAFRRSGQNWVNSSWSPILTFCQI